VLRVEMRERVNAMDPRGWDHYDEIEEVAGEKLLSLVYERLIRIDDSGKPQAGLATSWQHDANFTHWQFQLRTGVKFHDGTPLSAAIVADALRSEESGPWPVSVLGSAVAFEFENPRPSLLEELSTGRSFVFRPSQDTVFGTGPFRITDWQPQKYLALIAWEEYWAGRPFVDRIEIGLGVAGQQQITDLATGKADVIEVLPSQIRAVAQISGARVSVSEPAELLALAVAPFGSGSNDPRIGQALSLAVDRTAIVNVLLQRQGEPAGSLLPQWISGYAFLFPTSRDVVRAQRIRAEYSASPLKLLVYDSDDPSAVLIAQRIAVNARDAGINLIVAAESTRTADSLDVRLFRWRIRGPDARAAIENFVSGSSEKGDRPPSMTLDTPEQRYAAERAVLDRGRIIPVAFVPEIYGVGAAVKDWMPPRWGGWRLEDVWLEQAPGAGSSKSGTGNN
jgi:ABC-type transport system substrate-binding protein